MISIVHQGNNHYNIYRDGKCIGLIGIRENEYHNRHAYLDMGLTEYDPRDAQELFSQLHAQVGKPLQVMTASGNSELVRFLTAGGFLRKRRCFEVEAGAQDLVHSVSPMVPLALIKAGKLRYEECCRILFAYYASTHAAVSPLTADFATFCRILPGQVLCQEEGQAISHLAFVEEGEIAYAASRDVQSAGPFLQSLVARMLAEWGSVSFECDDCDPLAMKLRELFQNQEEESYDTYICDHA